MRTLLLILFLSSTVCAQGPVGGATAIPPLANTFATNEAPNSGQFSGNLSGWVTLGTVVYDATNHHSTGAGSAKMTYNGGQTSLLEARNLASTAEFFVVRAWAKTSGGTDTSAIRVTISDLQHKFINSSLVSGSNARVYTVVGPNQDWTQVIFEISVPRLHRSDGAGLGWFVDFNLPSTWVAGSLWLDDIQIQPAWYPIRSYLIYPNFHGYLWNDKTPPARYSPGTTPVLGQIDGASELVDPTNTLANDTLNVTIATAAGCGSGVLSIKAIAAPTATQYWHFVPADYGVLSVGTAYYVCTRLNVTAGGALVAAYNDWKIVYENAAFRNALTNYIDIDGAIVAGGTRKTYLETTAALDVFGSGSTTPTFSSGSSCTPNQSTAIACYQNTLQGPGPTTVSPHVVTGVPSLTYYYTSPTNPPTEIASIVNEGDNLINWDFIYSDTMDPRAGAGDSFSPMVDALHASNIDLHFEMNAIWANPIDHLWHAGGVTPTFAPAMTVTTGTITANFLFVIGTATQTDNAQGEGGTYNFSVDKQTFSQTLPSSVITVDLTMGGCAGTNCGVTFTAPACASVTQGGWYIYTATNTTSTPPATTTFARQYPTTVPAQIAQGMEIPCGSAVTLAALNATGIVPPIVDGTKGQMPAWASNTITDATVQTNFATAAVNGSHPGVVMWHVEDEPALLAIREAWYISQQLLPNANGVLTECTLGGATSDAALWRDLCDVTSPDPYDLGIYGGWSSAEGLLVPSGSTLPGGFFTDLGYSLNNTTTSFSSTPDHVDEKVDDVSIVTYGSRPIHPLMQQFGASVAYAVPYAHLWNDLIRGYIGCRKYGNNGCGGAKWGILSDSQGLGTAFASVAQGGFGDTNAYTDSVTAGTNWNGLSAEWRQTVSDSSQLTAGTGQVDGVNGETLTGGAILSKVKVDTAVSTTCGSGSPYTTRTYGPLDFFTVAGTNNKQYVEVKNLCPLTFIATFTAANLPVSTTSATVYGESRTISLTGSAWSDTFSGFATHIYLLDSSAGTTITSGVKVTSGVSIK